MNDHTTQRYTAVAVVLHWLIAFTILINLGLGWWMHDAIDEDATRAVAVSAFQLHKSLGLTVLALSVLRLLWRLAHRPPALPATLGRLSRLAAHGVHWALYFLMVLAPLSGWVLVSVQWRGDAPLQVPTLWFGLFEVPHLAGLNTAEPALRQEWWGAAMGAHELLANLMALLLLAHIGAACWHHFKLRDDVLQRMMPVGDSVHRSHARTPRERAVLWIGRALVLGLLILVVMSLQPASPEKSARDAAMISSEGDWVVDPAQSYIRFAGRHAGSAFSGEFTDWTVRAALDPSQPAGSTVEVDIRTASARTGDSMYDSTLREDEWFDARAQPRASFRSTVVISAQQGLELDGTLTVKGNAVPISGLALQMASDSARIEGSTTLDRAALDLGMESDPDAEWVSAQIAVDVLAVFRRAD